MALAVRLCGFRLAFQSDVAYDDSFHGIDGSGIISLAAIKGEHPLGSGIIKYSIRITPWDFYFTDDLQGRGIEDGNRTTAAIAGECAPEVRRELYGVRLVTISHVNFPYDVAVRVHDHDVLTASYENSMRDRIGSEVIPATLSTEHHFFDQMITDPS